MESTRDGRKSYEESFEVLVAEGLVEAPCPPLPSKMPAYDDEELLGVSFFRMHLEDLHLSGLTLPRTFFGRSLVARCRWSGTDLSGSCLCWNDFEDCDFAGASLAGADLRASNFERCSFASADLSGADARGSFFGECSFENATVSGMRVTAEQKDRLPLDPRQRELVVVEDEGEEPPGG
jgi:hypothetical protein